MTEHRRDEMPDMQACVMQAEHGDLKALCPKLTGEQQKEMRRWNNGAGNGSRITDAGTRDPPREKAD